MIKKFPHYTQLDAMDCGPTCLRMIAKYYGRSYTLQTLRERSFITREGVSMLGISNAAESIFFRTRGVKISLEQLKRDLPLPCILHWDQDHFVVLYEIQCGKLKTRNKQAKFFVDDPAAGKVVYTEDEFKRHWVSSKKERRT